MNGVGIEERRRIDALLADGRRKLLGLVGAPGAGKSTLAAALLAALGERAQVVPMDGLPPGQRRVAATGSGKSQGRARYLRQRRLRGAAGASADAGRRRDRLHARVQAGDRGTCGRCDRRAARDAAGDHRRQLSVARRRRLGRRGGLLDEVWYVDVDDTLREARLVGRHRQFGRSEEDARAWVAQTDAPNARLIAATRMRAHHVLTLD